MLYLAADRRLARPAPRHVILLVQKLHTVLWHRRRWHKHSVLLVRFLIPGHEKYVAEAMVDVYDTVEGTWGLLQPLNYGRESRAWPRMCALRHAHGRACVRIRALRRSLLRSAVVWQRIRGFGCRVLAASLAITRLCAGGKLVGAGAGNCVAFGGGGHRPAADANHTHGDVDVYCVAE